MAQVARRLSLHAGSGQSSDLTDQVGVVPFAPVRRGPRIREDAAERVRSALSRHDITEKPILRGVAFMLNDKMVASASRLTLLLRVGKDGQAAALSDACASLAEMRNGRPMSDYVKIDHAGLSDAELGKWVDTAVAYVRELTAPRRS